MEGITLEELTRLQRRLESDFRELHRYCHDNGHKVANLENVYPFLTRRVDTNELDLKQMKEAADDAENSAAGRQLLADIKTVTELGRSNNRAFEKHDRQIDSLRKFMWLAIGATAVINILIPLAVKYFLR